MKIIVILIMLLCYTARGAVTGGAAAGTLAGNTFATPNGTSTNLIGSVPVSSQSISTNYVVTQAQMNGVLAVTASAGFNVQLPAAPNIGDSITIIQMGTGQLTITVPAGPTLVNRQSQFKTAGQYAVVSALYVATNKYILSGDTGP